MSSPGTTTPESASPPPDAAGDARVPGGGRWPGLMKMVRKLGPAGWMGLFSLAIPPIGAVILLSQLDRFAEPLQHNAWGPFAAAGSFGLLGGLALLPTAALAIFAGWAFKFWIGFAVAVSGFTLAGTIGYAISRRLSGCVVVDLIDRYPRWNAVHRALLHSGGWRTFLIVLLLRVPSAPPFAMTSVGLAALHVKVWPFILGTFLGVMPRTALYVVLASKATTLDYDVASGWVTLVLLAAATLAVIVVLTVLARRALTLVTADDATEEAPSPSP